MPRALPFYTADVFTERRFAGNPLAIVEDADGLTTDEMQTIAREFNLSETIFVQTPDDPAHTAKVRIFFPTAEIPFAGHPTIGCAIHLARKANSGSGEFETVVTLEEVAGLVPVKVVGHGRRATAQLTAPVVPFASPGPFPDVEMAAAALGLKPSDICFGSHSIRKFQGGPHYIFIPLNSREALAKSRPHEPGWSRMTELAGIEAAYIYVCDLNRKNAYHARMFAPGNGTPEDPATGSASAIFAAQLLETGELEEGTNSFDLCQGEDMGRRSDLVLEVDLAAGRLTAVRISGTSVGVSSGTIEIG